MFYRKHSSVSLHLPRRLSPAFIRTALQLFSPLPSSVRFRCQQAQHDRPRNAFPFVPSNQVCPVSIGVARHNSWAPSSKMLHLCRE